MNKQLIVSMLLSLNAMQGMQADKGPAILYETDSNGDVWYPLPDGTRIKETYDAYYSSLDGSRTLDDVKLHFTIARPLFIQLVAQAAKEKKLDKAPFNELVSKIRNAVISTQHENVMMTHKDARHRLLSYIPEGAMKNCLVNGKIVKMITVLGTRAVEKKAEERSALNNVTVYDDELPDSCFIFPAYEKGCSSRGTDRELTGQDTLSCHHNFLKNPEHHAKVVEEFNALIKG